MILVSLQRWENVTEFERFKENRIFNKFQSAACNDNREGTQSRLERIAEGRSMQQKTMFAMTKLNILDIYRGFCFTSSSINLARRVGRRSMSIW